MKFAKFQKAVKPWMLPFAMFLGVVLNNYIGYVAFLSKYQIFIMLLITYCRVKISDFKIDGSIGLLLSAQIIGALALFFLLRPINLYVAQGAFICVFCPTATAAPVITGMLGGSVSRVATYSLFSHVSVAFLSPVLLALMAEEGGGADITLVDPVLSISRNVLPLILAPLALALLMQRFSPKAHKEIAEHQGLSFYIWAFALILVVGNSVSFLLEEPSEAIWTIIAVALVAFLCCVGQFWLGRKIGGRYGDKIAGAQSLGQKNTVLAVWLSLTYLNPIVSAAPAAYVAWHNIVNSLQIYVHEKKLKGD